jgi:hypothetical protein
MMINYEKSILSPDLVLRSVKWSDLEAVARPMATR